MEPAEPKPRRYPKIDPRLKVAYLLGVALASLVTPALWRPFVVAGLLAAQVIILLVAKQSARELAALVSRLRFVAVFLLVCYAFLPGAPDDQIWHWHTGVLLEPVRVNVTGITRACLMIGQIFTLVLASAVVRLGGSDTDLVEGLKRLRCPRLLLYSLDATLALLGPSAGRGAGRRGGGDGSVPTLAKGLIKGDAQPLAEAFEAGLGRASERLDTTFDAQDAKATRLKRDVATISTIAVLMVSLRFFKILPGIPFASGLKSTVSIPLYILAAELTASPLGATTVGTIAGLLAFLNGEGRYGVFEVLRPIVPGLVIDALWPIVRRLPSRFACLAILGALAAATNVATELALAFCVGARWEVFLFPVPRLISNLVFGALSGPVSYALLRAVRAWQAASPVPATATVVSTIPVQPDPSVAAPDEISTAQEE